MSFYATLQGEVQYPNQDSFDAVILILRNGVGCEFYSADN